VRDVAKMPRSPRQRLVATVLIAISLAVVSAAEVDLHRRPAAKVRGDKRIWRLVCLNALGALAYLFFGRQEA
jgi:hypothetical protein